MQISVCVSAALLSPLPTQPCWLLISLLTFIAYSSLSVASPATLLLPNIWLPQCRFVFPTLFHYLSTVLICSVSTHSQNPLNFLIYHDCLPDFYRLEVRANLKRGTFFPPLSFICSAVWPLTYWSASAGHALIVDESVPAAKLTCNYQWNQSIHPDW